MNIGSWILALLVLMVLSSCKKEGSTGPRVWEGRVLEYGSDKPVAGATVYLLEVSGEILGPGGSRVVDSLVSDGAGRFTFRYADNPKASHRIRALGDQHYQSEVSAGSNRSRISKDIVLEPYAWLSLRIKAPDKDVYQIVIETYGCNPREFLNGERDVEVLCSLRGNKNNSIKYHIGILQGQSIRDEKEVYLPALDTTYVEYTY